MQLMALPVWMLVAWMADHVRDEGNYSLNVSS